MIVTKVTRYKTGLVDNGIVKAMKETMMIKVSRTTVMESMTT